MSKVEALRRALIELGDSSSEALAAYMTTHYAVRVEPRIVPVLRAMIRDKELLARWKRPPETTPPSEAA